MAFITINIGVNDMLGRCMDFHTGILHRGCVVEMRPVLRHRLIHIIDALRAAAGPDVPILGMTYHDPFLGFWDWSRTAERWRRSRRAAGGRSTVD